MAPLFCITVALWSILSTIDGAPCNQSYSDKTTTYIENNKQESSIYYLGTKSSANECRDSCLDFNYLCDKSSSSILYNDGANITFDNDSCSITILGAIRNNIVYINITDEPIISSNYIIEVLLTQHNGSQTGFYWKSNNGYYDYYFMIAPLYDCETCYSDPGAQYGYQVLSKTSPQTSYNTRYTLSTTVNDSSFATYLNGEQHYYGSFESSHSSYGFAGLYAYKAHTTYHSFKIIFPSGGYEEKICAAYLFDSSNECYAYYGADFTTIENSVSPKTNYDSGIFYPNNCPTAQPTAGPTTKPTLRPTDHNPATCGDTIIGSYNGESVTFIVNIPYCGDLEFNAALSSFMVTNIDVFTTLDNAHIATDADNDEIVRLYNIPTGDYKFAINADETTTGTFEAIITCTSANPTTHPSKYPTSDPTQPHSNASLFDPTHRANVSSKSHTTDIQTSFGPTEAPNKEKMGNEMESTHFIETNESKQPAEKKSNETIYITIIICLSSIMFIYLLYRLKNTLLRPSHVVNVSNIEAVVADDVQPGSIKNNSHEGNIDDHEDLSVFEEQNEGEVAAVIKTSGNMTNITLNNDDDDDDDILQAVNETASGNIVDNEVIVKGYDDITADINTTLE